MSLIPEFRIGLWNGWILSAIFLIPNYFPMFIAPKENIKELMEQVKQAKGRDKLVSSLSRIPNFGIMVYSIFVPLKIGTPWFYIGLAFFVIGEIGGIISGIQLSFKKPGQPMFKGFYSLSRNPIYVFLNIILISIGIVTASWLILALAVISMILNHYIILAEERFCLEKYGDSYREYMIRVPRYFLFLKKVLVDMEI
ncbi:isoprenylcysteine carboxylmethyltransferase family protein [candidate division WOR-3 bacterium]|nr:isoprenylcysteine carboxylmethyltransferase family protein [candidate division WOR-3 bacterium]